jgi:hypothetical protein
MDNKDNKDNKDKFCKKLRDLYCERIDKDKNEITLKCYPSFSKAEVVGYTTINMNSGKIISWYVNPKYRFQNFGKLLCDEIEKSFGDKLESHFCVGLSSY